jgi:hypothetical protein
VAVAQRTLFVSLGLTLALLSSGCSRSPHQLVNEARMHKLEVQGIIALASSGHERREKVAAYKDKHSAELQALRNEVIKQCGSDDYQAHLALLAYCTLQQLLDADKTRKVEARVKALCRGR